VVAELKRLEALLAQAPAWRLLLGRG
jgi:hypothetical protein